MKDPVLERNKVLYRLDLAVTHLQESMSGLLIPDDGASLGYAVKGARDRESVAAVTGGMVLCVGRVTAGGTCAFGADVACARSILTVMKTNPLIRSAATVKFSENALDVFEAMLLECVPLDQSVKAPPISTMIWGIAACCTDGVPDVIYDDGRNKKPGIMYIFGEDPLVVTNNIIICSDRMLNIEL
ncbi:MAG: thiamine-phosphate synthase family protein [Methanomicrobiales archaeon]